MSPSACCSLLIVYMVHLCAAFHYPRLENGICSLKGGHCLLPSDASVCNPLDAKCDEGHICCEVPIPMPEEKMRAALTKSAVTIAKQAEATCSSQTKDVNGESGSISVWSENGYENDLDCQWQITVAAGKVILIEWQNFDIEYYQDCDYDYVEILGQKYCGSVMPNSITSPSNQVLVKFHTDYSEQMKGFSHTFSSVATATSDCGVVNSQTRIAGGEETLMHQYPWQVALVTNGGSKPFCGGSIISSRWILTAAHCFTGKSITTIKVVVGEHDWSTTDETTFTTKVDIEQLVMHPSYIGTKTNRDNDIGLIKLMSELTFTQANHVAPICLPPIGTQDQFENVEAIVSGWGSLFYLGNQPHILNDVTVPTTTNAQCRQSYGPLFTENMICTGLPEGGKSPCSWDSGGPLVTQVNGHMIQIGIVNFATGCALPKYPNVYARVTSFMKWILSYVDDAAF